MISLKPIIKIVSAIYWALYRLTPNGKKAYMFKMATANLAIVHQERVAAKTQIIKNSRRHVKPKKILGFIKGGSVTKSKKSNHQIIEATKQENAQLLKERGLRITTSGKIKNA